MKQADFVNIEIEIQKLEIFGQHLEQKSVTGPKAHLFSTTSQFLRAKSKVEK